MAGIVMVDELRNVELFAGLSDTDLQQLCNLTDELRIQPGELLFSEGDAGNAAYVIKEGELEVTKVSDGRDVLLAVRKPGDVIGEMSVLEETPRMASVRARTAAILLVIPKDHFDALLDKSSTAVRAILQTVIARGRGTRSMLQQSEKMAQLGTLTAGLAHELNNPAAAVQRGAEQLRLASERIEAALAELKDLNITNEQLGKLLDLIPHIRERAKSSDGLDAMTRSDREEKLETWLDDNGYDEPWDLGPSLVTLGYGPEEVRALSSGWSHEQFQVAVRWITGTYSLCCVMDEIHQGSTRISQLVMALKSYAFLDRAPVQSVDIHVGLDNTLVLLSHKLKAGVGVNREYADDLPSILAYGSQLNQVWTNIFDNAIDAMNGKGELTIRTSQRGDSIIVEIVDDGPGIPEEIQPRIFEAFFTTKEPGKGTGMGLDISYNIVVHRHQGNIRVKSEPGRTCFEIKLPINFERDDANAP